MLVEPNNYVEGTLIFKIQSTFLNIEYKFTQHQNYHHLAKNEPLPMVENIILNVVCWPIFYDRRIRQPV